MTYFVRCITHQLNINLINLAEPFFFRDWFWIQQNNRGKSSFVTVISYKCNLKCILESIFNPICTMDDVVALNIVKLSTEIILRRYLKSSLTWLRSDAVTTHSDLHLHPYIHTWLHVLTSSCLKPLFNNLFRQLQWLQSWTFKLMSQFPFSGPLTN